jgi:transcriptional antiterminator NusG
MSEEERMEELPAEENGQTEENMSQPEPVAEEEQQQAVVDSEVEPETDEAAESAAQQPAEETASEAEMEAAEEEPEEAAEDEDAPAPSIDADFQKKIIAEAQKAAKDLHPQIEAMAAGISATEEEEEKTTLPDWAREAEARVSAGTEEGEAEEEEEEISTPLLQVGAREEEDEEDRNWYVVHCYSGYENKVRHNLEQRIESMGMKDLIFDVVVPTEEEIEVKEGKRRSVERRVFPGYILVNMTLTEESWYVVRNTPGVTSFVGMGNEPLPLRPEEVSSIIKRMEADAPRIKVTFRQGERVRIIDGPFNDFRGTVSEIDMERAKVRVMVNFFGRETPVELDFLQVEKA